MGFCRYRSQHFRVAINSINRTREGEIIDKKGYPKLYKSHPHPLFLYLIN